MLAYLFVGLGILVHILGGNGTMPTLGFVPLGASLLFFGAHRSRREFFFLLPLLIGADFYLNYRFYGYKIQPDQYVTFAWYLGACFLGSLLKNRIRPVYVAGASLAASISFFLVSNFAVWAAYTMYPKNFGGLIACYVAGIPFFEKGIVSDLLFSAIFFIIPVLASRLSEAVTARHEAI